MLAQDTRIHSTVITHYAQFWYLHGPFCVNFFTVGYSIDLAEFQIAATTL